MHLLHLFPIPHHVARHLEGNENSFPPFPALSDDQSLIRDIFALTCSSPNETNGNAGDMHHVLDILSWPQKTNRKYI